MSAGIHLMPHAGILYGTGLMNQEQVPLGINPKLLVGMWPAQWVTYPTGSLREYGVYHFRKHITLGDVPATFVIHISADNRYRFFVNGTHVCDGPARGDLLHWRFDTINIAEYLRSGENVLSAVVWNFGEYAPVAQMSYETAFILQGNGETEQVANTNASWKVFKNEAYIAPTERLPETVVGPADQVIGERYPFGWEESGFDDHRWSTPKLTGPGMLFGTFGYWERMLVPRSIPFMENKVQRLLRVVRARGITVNDLFLKGDSPVHIPPGKKVHILLDQTHETNAYFELSVSEGKDSVVRIGYAEALVDDHGEKGNRNEVEGKKLLSAYWDEFLPDGGNNRIFSTLWFRCYRYVALEIETRESPLVINDVRGYYTAYPFEEKATFNSNDPVLKKIWDVSWRTARLCAGETYFDCPYYEQLQYVGDTRIQALISLYVSGDDRLMRNAIDQFNDSFLSIGLTQSRYPTEQPQVIPPYSLFWIVMLHDFYMHRDDLKFLKKFQTGAANILHWYREKLNSEGLLGPMDWWNFVDWSFGPWRPDRPSGGVPPGGIEGGSSIISLQYVYALQKGAELFKVFGDNHQFEECKRLADKIAQSVFRQCWSESRQLLADMPNKKTFSQHANIMAVLAGMFDEQRERQVLMNSLKGGGLTEATFYFKFYLFRAMNKAGLGNQYIQQLKPWKEMLDLGLTTFAETPEPSRSDCHAWSAHPAYDLLATVCGIEPGSAGFKTVRIAPHPGGLRWLQGRMPHPKGEIIVQFEHTFQGLLSGEIILPKGVTGEFVWQGRIKRLHEGKQTV